MQINFSEKLFCYNDRVVCARGNPGKKNSTEPDISLGKQTGKSRGQFTWKKRLIRVYHASATPL